MSDSSTDGLEQICASLPAHAAVAVRRAWATYSSGKQPMDKDLKYSLGMAASLLQEAAAVLEALSPDVLEKLPNWRWPLTDELGGAALILLDHVKAQSKP